MSAQYQTIISKSMEQSFVTCIQQTVKLLAETYQFDYEEALALFDTDNLKVATNLGKTKGGVTGGAPKRTKPKFPLPFTGEVFDDCCRAIVFNSGLFTQCLKAPKPDSQDSLCQTCEKQAVKNPTGSPPLGYISDRVERGEDWADPKGRRPVPYTKVMNAKKFTQEEVMAEVSNNNMNIDMTIFDDTDTEKRGRKKGGKKTEAQAVFEDDEDAGMLDELIQQMKDSESETSEASKTSKTSKTSKKSKEEREAEKLEKASQKSELDKMKAEEKMMKELRKKEDNIAKEHEKQMKEQQKEAIRLLKERKEEEKRLAKEAKDQEKAAKELEKAAKAQAKADAKRPVKQIKEEKRPQPGAEESEEVDPVEESVEEKEEVDPLDEFEELEEVPPSPLSPPPEETEPVVEVEPVVEPKPEPVVEKPKMKKFKFQGVSYVVDDASIVYRKDAPKVRVGVYTEDGLVFDEKDESEEEDEEELSDVE